MDDFEELSYPPELPKELEFEEASFESRIQPLNLEQFSKFCDSNDRIVDEHELRRRIFRGGIESSLRSRIWPYLFGLYSFSSTKRECDAVRADLCAKYQAMKRRWQIVLRSHHEPKIHSPSYLQNIPHAETQREDAQDPQRKCLILGAEMYAGRQKFDTEHLKDSVRVVDKDVPRTDRDNPFFSGNENVHLRMLRDLLITYAAFHPEVGYVQGMNDIAARFLVVTQSEEVSYWCLVHYLEHMVEDFIADTMLHKLKSVSALLGEMDPDLMRFLDGLGVSDLGFCHRWMLLSFKREFQWEDGLRCFEILYSRHLELSSPEAQRQQEIYTHQQFESSGGTNRTAAVSCREDFSFEVFLCAAVLISQRERFFRECSESGDAFAVVSSLTKQLSLDAVLTRTERLFHSYCRKSAADCFQLVEPLSPNSRHSADAHANRDVDANRLDHRLVDAVVSASPKR